MRSRWLDIGQVLFLPVKLAKKRSQYPAILTEKAWSIEDLLFGFRGNFSRGTRREVPRKPITARYLVHFARSRS